ncbi:uncharacterized protein E6C27_scaffold239G001680 [Cucumis melo var. makuwa]|uniref:Uncharacterized protein n=1 Tax=Cucumis melo var. makuwa TaxID=1194695 RepID=A0A5A7SWR1_CUCMM|nr:uncharacterized protein E6C27_scaffold239G001680 [Cucumis melo var. makuwa]
MKFIDWFVLFNPQSSGKGSCEFQDFRQFRVFPLPLEFNKASLGSFDMHKMDKWKGSGKLGRLVPRGGSMTSYKYALLLSPVVSVWDCIVRKMRYSYRPEWV